MAAAWTEEMRKKADWLKSSAQNSLQETAHAKVPLDRWIPTWLIPSVFTCFYMLSDIQMSQPHSPRCLWDNRILQGWGLSFQHRFTPNEVLKGTDRTVLLSAPQRQNPEDSFSRYRADVFASAWILFYFSCPVVQSGRIFMEYWVSSSLSCPLQWPLYLFG